MKYDAIQTSRFRPYASINASGSVTYVTSHGSWTIPCDLTSWHLYTMHEVVSGEFDSHAIFCHNDFQFVRGQGHVERPPQDRCCSLWGDTPPGFVWCSVGDGRDPEQCQAADGSARHEKLPDGHESGDCRCWVERNSNGTQ